LELLSISQGVSFHLLYILSLNLIIQELFNRLGAVILLVSDIDRSSRFYPDILGMELKQQASDWAEFSQNGTVLVLHPSKLKKAKKNNSILVGFNLSDLGVICSNLKNKKVKFYKKLTKEKFGNHAIVMDPNGHLISLVEMTTPKEQLRHVPYYHGFAPV